jgi:hypothetical protein
VNGRSYTQPVTVENDPRSPAKSADLAAQHALLMKVYDGIRQAWTGHEQVQALKRVVGEAAGTNAPSEVSSAVKAFQAKIDSVGGSRDGGGRRPFRGGGGPTPPPNFVGVNGTFVGLLGTLEPGDLAPTAAMEKAYVSACKQLATVITAWQSASGKDLSALNAQLTARGLRAVVAPAPALTVPPCTTPAPPKTRKRSP